MPHLVDGNNLLGLGPDMRVKDPGARGRLVTQLAAFARARRSRVTVVFDGEISEGSGATEQHLGDVTVVFAGRSTDADRVILKILDASNDPAGFILVTSDRALGNAARHRRARIVTSLRFRRELVVVGPSQDSSEGKLTPEQIKDWEDWFNSQGQG